MERKGEKRVYKSTSAVYENQQERRGVKNGWNVCVCWSVCVVYVHMLWM